MPSDILEYLLRQLDQGDCLIGQVRISGRFILCHQDDEKQVAKEVYVDPHDAIKIARYDDEGKYRPLKSAPNLRHGWRMELTEAQQVLQALDFLYPAAVGTAKKFQENTLHAVSLRETLERQSGMYAVVKKISDGQARALIEDLCCPKRGCLKKILWNIEAGALPAPDMGAASAATEIPLLCSEACNLLIAAGRTIVKGNAQQAQP